MTSDGYAAEHGGLAPILVVADNNGSDPEQWAIGGLSEGGMCGLMLSLRHPEQYRTPGGEHMFQVWSQAFADSLPLGRGPVGDRPADADLSPPVTNAVTPVPCSL